MTPERLTVEQIQWHTRTKKKYNFRLRSQRSVESVKNIVHTEKKLDIVSNAIWKQITSNGNEYSLGPGVIVLAKMNKFKP